MADEVKWERFRHLFDIKFLEEVGLASQSFQILSVKSVIKLGFPLRLDNETNYRNKYDRQDEQKKLALTFFEKVHGNIVSLNITEENN